MRSFTTVLRILTVHSVLPIGPASIQETPNVITSFMVKPTSVCILRLPISMSKACLRKFIFASTDFLFLRVLYTSSYVYAIPNVILTFSNAYEEREEEKETKATYMQIDSRTPHTRTDIRSELKPTSFAIHSPLGIP